MSDESTTCSAARTSTVDSNDGTRASGTREARYFSRETLHRCGVLVTLLLAATLFHVVFRPKGILHTTDSMFYLSGAKSLAEGNGYRMVVYEGEPRIGLYPPLQSAYLSLFWRLNGTFPDNLPLLHFAMLLLLLAFLTLLFFTLLKFRFPLWASALVPFCFAIQPSTFGAISGCYSDLLFSLLITFLALIWLERQPSPMRWAATGIVLGMMFLTRTAAGPILLGAVFVSFIYAVRLRAWKPFAFCAVPAAAAVVFWMVLPKETAGYGTYFRLEDTLTGEPGWPGYLMACGRRAVRYASTYVIDCFASGLPNLTAAIIPGSAVWRTISFVAFGILAALSVAICVVGYATHPGRGVQIIGGILLLYCAQLVFWPFDIYTRGLVPLLPFLCFGFQQGLAFLPDLLRRSAVRSVSFLLLLGIVPSALMVFSDIYKGGNQERPDEVTALSRWVAENIPPASRVAVSVDWFKSDFPMLHFNVLSGHKLIPTKGQGLESYISRSDYVLYEGFPVNKNSVAFGLAGLQGHVVYRTPQNMFQVVRVEHTNSARFASSQSAGLPPVRTH